MKNECTILWGLSLLCGLSACSDDSPSSVADAAGPDAVMDAAGSDVSMDAAGPDVSMDAAGPDVSMDAAADAAPDAAVDPRPDAALDPHPRLADLADETALDLGPFGCTAPAEEGETWCRAVTDYSGLVYDSIAHELLMFGGGHATTMTDAIFAFDLNDTLRWNELYEPTPCSVMVASNLDAELGAWKMGTSGPYPRPLSVHTYDLNAFSPEQDAFIMLGRSFTGGTCNTVGNDVSGPIAHYDLSAGTWSFSDAAPSSSIAASELDPTTGLLVVLGSDGLKLYDPTARRYTDEIDVLQDAQGGAFDVNGLGYANHMVYFPPNDTFYYFMRGQPVEVVALKLDRASPGSSTLELVATEGPSSPHDEPGYDYDSVNQVIGGGVHENTFYELDPTTGTWTAHPIQGGAPGTQAFHALGYDPTSNVFVFVTDPGSGQHSWAFRLR